MKIVREAHGTIREARLKSGRIEPGKEQMKTANWVDAYVGSRVRLRRRNLGLSQQKLGDALGITFQQVQKCEKGVNRIGAGRLLNIAECLNVPIAYFFPESAAGSPSLDISSEIIGGTAQSGITSEALEMVQLFAEITDPDLRNKIVSLVRVLSEQHQALDSKA